MKGWFLGDDQKMMTSPIISILTIVTTNRGICLRELLTLIINFALQVFDKENYRFFYIIILVVMLIFACMVTKVGVVMIADLPSYLLYDE